jgi:cytoskeleton protein RodZ
MQKADDERMTFVKPVEPGAAPQAAPVTVAATKLPAVPVAAPVGTAPVETAPVETAAPPAPVQEPPRDGTRRIELRFERASWVQIRGGDGQMLMSRLNEAGTERTIEGRAPFEVVIGNARHVRLHYDSKPVDLAPHLRSDVARLTLE